MELNTPRPIEVKALVQKLVEQIKKRGYKPTKIVYIANDGNPVAEMLAERLHCLIVPIIFRRTLSRTQSFVLRRFPFANQKGFDALNQVNRWINKYAKVKLKKAFPQPVSENDRIILMMRLAAVKLFLQQKNTLLSWDLMVAK